MRQFLNLNLKKFLLLFILVFSVTSLVMVGCESPKDDEDKETMVGCEAPEESNDDDTAADTGDTGDGNDNETNEEFMLISSFNAPNYESSGNHPAGFAFDGTFLWLSMQGNNKVYKLGVDGAVILACNTNTEHINGLTFDGEYLYVHDQGRGEMLKYSINWELQETYSSPKGDDIAFDGENFWFASSNEHKIFKLDKNMNVLDSFEAPGGDTTGLAFDGDYLWHGGFGDPIFKLDLEGNIIKTYSAPSNSVLGLTFDGNNLWVSEHDEQKIYKVKIK